jgi:hypothetical protein
MLLRTIFPDTHSGFIESLEINRLAPLDRDCSVGHRTKFNLPDCPRIALAVQHDSLLLSNVRTVEKISMRPQRNNLESF